jgi:hypothetical protein
MTTDGPETYTSDSSSWSTLISINCEERLGNEGGFCPHASMASTGTIDTAFDRSALVFAHHGHALIGNTDKTPWGRANNATRVVSQMNAGPCCQRVQPFLNCCWFSCVPFRYYGLHRCKDAWRASVVHCTLVKYDMNAQWV